MLMEVEPDWTATINYVPPCKEKLKEGLEKIFMDYLEKDKQAFNDFVNLKTSDGSRSRIAYGQRIGFQSALMFLGCKFKWTEEEGITGISDFGVLEKL